VSTLGLILVQSAVAIAAALALWVWLARLLAGRIRSRLRAVPLALPLLLAAVGYGLYWLAFFSSPTLAVQMHAIRLTFQHLAGPFLPFIAAVWLGLAVWPLAPLFRRA
jgi:hypothetical protein